MKRSGLSVHTIPVPEGWSIEQAWEAISRGDKLPDGPCEWANIFVKDNCLVKVIPAGV